MGSLGRRLERLEERIKIPEEENQRAALREFLSRLTDEELDWLDEPGEPEEEHRRRWAALVQRREEILAREDWSTAWLRRHGIRARASSAKDAHETEDSE